MLARQGQWLDAEKFLRQTLEANKKQLGEHHFITLDTISELATTVESQGRLTEAENLYWQSIEGFKELGACTVDALHSMLRLAMMLIVQQKFEEAAKLTRQAWEGFKDIDEHNMNTIRCTRVLAGNLNVLGQYKEAAELYEQAYAGYMAHYGPQNSETIECYEEFAALQEWMQQAGSGEGTVSTQPTQDTSLDNDLQG